MLKNYLLIAIRNLWGQKVFSLINVVGLAVGMVCSILIVILIRHDLSFDTHHKNRDVIYRIVKERGESGGAVQYRGQTSGPLADVLRREIPGIQQVVKFMRRPKMWVRYGNEGAFQVFCVSEPNIFEMFTMPLVVGDAKTVLARPASVVLTQEAAYRFFGKENPIGRVVVVDEPHARGTYTVTGVLKDFPKTSTIQFDFLASPVGNGKSPAHWNRWRAGSSGIETFVMLPQNVSLEVIETKLAQVMERYFGEETAKRDHYRLQPLARNYLYSISDYGNRLVPAEAHLTGDIQTVYVLLGIALCVVIIACVNFINLTTARSVRRAKEVGVRKVVGAHRSQLIGQFLGESILLAIIGLVVALSATYILLPSFGAFVGKELSWDLLQDLSVGVMLVGWVVVVGVLAGSYPAFLLSKLQPVETLKGVGKMGGVSAGLRKVLVVGQFAVSVGLVVAALVVYGQLDYINNKDLGFNRAHKIGVPIFLASRSEHRWGNSGWMFKGRYNTIKRAFEAHPNVLKAGVGNTMPGVWGGLSSFLAKGQEWRMNYFPIDEDYLPLFDIPMVAGRNFTRAYIESDAVENGNYEFILNETAVKQIGWADPIGQSFAWEDQRGVVVGVVPDFFTGSLHKQLAPVVMLKSRHNFKWLCLEIREADLAGTMAFLEDQWKYFIPNLPFEYLFLDERISQHYVAENRLREVLTLFFALTIFVACLGLFGLSSFMAEQHKKEIGIRKVLGASVGGVLYLLLKDFMALIVIANMIAWPLAYYLMQEWLQRFVYRMDLGIDVFLLGGLLTLGVAVISVGYQTYRAAISNPVDALRYE